MSCIKKGEFSSWVIVVLAMVKELLIAIAYCKNAKVCDIAGNVSSCCNCSSSHRHIMRIENLGLPALSVSFRCKSHSCFKCCSTLKAFNHWLGIVWKRHRITTRANLAGSICPLSVCYWELVVMTVSKVTFGALVILVFVLVLAVVAKTAQQSEEWWQEELISETNVYVRREGI